MDKKLHNIDIIVKKRYIQTDFYKIRKKDEI